MTKYDELYLDNYKYDKGVVSHSNAEPKYVFFKECQIGLTKIRCIWKYE